jgi:hypothetical protein
VTRQNRRGQSHARASGKRGRSGAWTRPSPGNRRRRRGEQTGKGGVNGRPESGEAQVRMPYPVKGELLNPGGPTPASILYIKNRFRCWRPDHRHNCIWTGFSIEGILYGVNIDRPYGLTGFVQQFWRGGRDGEVSHFPRNLADSNHD